MFLSWSGTQFIVLVKHRTYYCPGQGHSLLSWSGTAYCPGEAQNMLLSWLGTQGWVQNVLAWYTLHCPVEAQNMLLFWSGTQCIVLVQYTRYCLGQVCRSCRQHTVLVRYTCYCPGQVRNVLP